LSSVGSLGESSKDSEGEDNMLVLVQVDVLVHDIEEVINIASIADSGNQTFVAGDLFKLNVFFREIS
jgi:hypothetical protein